MRADIGAAGYPAAAMFRIKDIRGESIVVADGFVEKYRLNDMRGRAPALDYVETQVKETSRRKKILFGEKEELLHVIVNVGVFMSLMVGADQRGEVDALIAELERARAAQE
jgi:hypothetical protein